MSDIKYIIPPDTIISVRLPKIMRVLFHDNESKQCFRDLVSNKTGIYVASYTEAQCAYNKFSISFIDGKLKIIYNDNTAESLDELFNQEIKIRFDQMTEFQKIKAELINICHTIVEILSV